ncbi:hypothetical protein F2P46_31445 [Massilia sp. CCM 8734]|nr:hypothetical protein [Massilia sp. CCM 8734]
MIFPRLVKLDKGWQRLRYAYYAKPFASGAAGIFRHGGRVSFCHHKTSACPALAAALLPYYPKDDGRSHCPMGLEHMPRMSIVQQCFGLSDEGVKETPCDSQAIIDAMARIDPATAK